MPTSIDTIIMLMEHDIPDPLWIFAYGSLMWKPGFGVAERARGVLSGYHRCFCMRSIHHRGTERAPGLVLALDPDANGRCEGVALRGSVADAAGVLAYLRERELISSAYREAVVEIDLADGRRARALAYVMDQDHEQYCGRLSQEEQAAIIARAVGGMGTNRDYLFATVAHLAEMGCLDPDLADLAERVRAIPPEGDR